MESWEKMKANLFRNETRFDPEMVNKLELPRFDPEWEETKKLQHAEKMKMRKGKIRRKDVNTFEYYKPFSKATQPDFYETEEDREAKLPPNKKMTPRRS
eukprot:Pgem_evm1s10460